MASLPVAEPIKKDDEKKNEETKPQLTAQQQTIVATRQQIQLIIKSVRTNDQRLIIRVLRQLNSTRKKLTGNVIKQLIREYDTELQGQFDKWNSAVMSDEQNTNEDLSVQTTTTSTNDEKSATTQTEEQKRIQQQQEHAAAKQRAEDESLPEVKIYVRLLVVVYLLEKNLLNEVRNEVLRRTSSLTMVIR